MKMKHPDKGAGPGSSSSSMASTLAGTILFLATAAIAQRIQRHRQRQESGWSDRHAGAAEERAGDTPSPPPEENAVTKQAFVRQRLATRLSFQQFEDRIEGGLRTPPIPNDYQNWRHFERSDEHERAERRGESQPPRQIPQQRRPGQRQIAGEGASLREGEGIAGHQLRQPSIEEGSDEESVLTFRNESEDNEPLSSFDDAGRRRRGLLPRSSSTSSFSNGDVEDSHRALRTEYNAQIMPEKLVLIRHGQSLGNVDEAFYATTPDNAMPLTDLGWEQAHHAGTVLRDRIVASGESVHFIVSPYVRTVETFHGLASAWCDPDGAEFAAIADRSRRLHAWYARLTELGLTWSEDPRIREQDFGNYQDPAHTRHAKEERHRFGAFYYRFNDGESGADVFDRVSTFLDSLWRSFETHKSPNYVLVTHGIVLRVLLARYFRYTIGQLDTLANPSNCEMVVLGHAGDGRLDLKGRCALELEEDPVTRRCRVGGHRFHRRLRILPKSHVRAVQFRISSNDFTLQRTMD